MVVAANLVPVMKPGFYNANSPVQESALRTTSPLLEEAVREVELPATGVIQILDCACSHGKNSSTAAKLILQALGERLKEDEQVQGQPQQLSVVFTHEDLPTNDFNTLLHTINDPQEGYLHQHHHQKQQQHLQVFTNLVGRSMYERLVPDSSLSIILALTCLHWTRSKPALPPDSLLSYLSDCEHTREAFRREFLAGLDSFLRHRAAEARPGAHLLAHFPVAARGSDPTACGILNDTAKALVAEGLLAAADLGHMASTDYVGEPGDATTALEAVSELWQVKSCKVHTITHPAWAQHQEGSISTQEVAKAYRCFWEAVFEPSYVSGLVAAGRPRPEAEGLVRLLFERVEAAFAAGPQPIVQDYIHFYLVRR